MLFLQGHHFGKLGLGGGQFSLRLQNVGFVLQAVGDLEAVLAVYFSEQGLGLVTKFQGFVELAHLEVEVGQVVEQGGIAGVEGALGFFEGSHALAVALLGLL
jgi:hypothetical protein